MSGQGSSLAGLADLSWVCSCVSSFLWRASVGWLYSLWLWGDGAACFLAFCRSAEACSLDSEGEWSNAGFSRPGCRTGTLFNHILLAKESRKDRPDWRIREIDPNYWWRMLLSHFRGDVFSKRWRIGVILPSIKVIYFKVVVQFTHTHCIKVVIVSHHYHNLVMSF